MTAAEDTGRVESREQKGLLPVNTNRKGNNFNLSVTFSSPVQVRGSSDDHVETGNTDSFTDVLQEMSEENYYIRDVFFLNNLFLLIRNPSLNYKQLFSLNYFKTLLLSYFDRSLQHAVSNTNPNCTDFKKHPKWWFNSLFCAAPSVAKRLAFSLQLSEMPAVPCEAEDLWWCITWTSWIYAQHNHKARSWVGDGARCLKLERLCPWTRFGVLDTEQSNCEGINNGKVAGEWNSVGSIIRQRITSPFAKPHSNPLDGDFYLEQIANIQEYQSPKHAWFKK